MWKKYYPLKGCLLDLLFLPYFPSIPSSPPPPPPLSQNNLSCLPFLHSYFLPLFLHFTISLRVERQANLSVMKLEYACVDISNNLCITWLQLTNCQLLHRVCIIIVRKKNVGCKEACQQLKHQNWSNIQKNSNHLQLNWPYWLLQFNANEKDKKIRGMMGGQEQKKHQFDDRLWR